MDAGSQRAGKEKKGKKRYDMILEGYMLGLLTVIMQFCLSLWLFFLHTAVLLHAAV
jgi:hypothetical protein